MSFGGGTKLTEMRRTENGLNYTWNYTRDQGTRQPDLCRIAVIGVGRAGNDTVTKLMDSGVTSVDCIAMNTDAAHLNASKASQKILIGEKLTRGRGVGGDPALGRAAIEESRKSAEDLLSGIDIAFITAGLGGGTGAGAAPIVAGIAKKKGAVTIGVVTMPFKKEKGRDKFAAKALAEMRRRCDTVVVIDNNKLMQLVPDVQASEASRVSDQVLANMIREIVETISTPSLINLNFSNFKTIVTQGGMAVIGVGESDAPNRAEEAVRNAFRNPSLDVNYAGATGALIHVIGDNRMTVEEANHVGEIVTEMMDRNARVIWGASVDPLQEGRLKVTLVMTGVNSPNSLNSFRGAAARLFNLDPIAEPERPIEIKLDLYQMETDSQ
jgi:cell division protein FtsZ